MEKGMKLSFRSVIAVLAVAAAVVWAAFSFWGDDEARNAGNPAVAQGPIVAFGDSLIEGVGASAGNDLVSILSRMAGEEIVNLGRSGDTTAAALSRIDAALARKPRVAIVLLGGNDFLRRAPRAETFANLQTIVEGFQAGGAAVIVLGVRGGVFGGAVEGEYEALAERTRSAYVSDVLDGLFGDGRYMADAIHPNDAGYARIAERVYPELERLIR